MAKLANRGLSIYLYSGNTMLNLTQSRHIPTFSQSNRFEKLLEKLCKELSPIPKPLSGFSFSDDECHVVVHSAATKRKLMLELADKQGICSNVQFHFLGEWIWKQVLTVLNIETSSLFASNSLRWRIFRILSNGHFARKHSRLEIYLYSHQENGKENKPDELMCFDLACRLAKLFELYMHYCPHWLEAWANGKPIPVKEDRTVCSCGKAIPPVEEDKHNDRAWQAALWKQIAEEDIKTGNGKPPLECTPCTLLEELRKKPAGTAEGKKQVHLFCEPFIAPYYLDLLIELGKWIDIKLYVLNPSKEYWFDIVDAKWLAWLAAQNREEHYEVGNRLLASWGKESRASLESIHKQLEETEENQADYEEKLKAVPNDIAEKIEALAKLELEEFLSALQEKETQKVLPYLENFFAPKGQETDSEGTPTLLSCIQDSILNLKELTPSSLKVDDSLQIHIAHSLTREIEILHDQLLQRFDKDKTLELSDILVVTPALDEAAPLIESVFSHNRSGERIPYVITGRTDSRGNMVARALLDLFSLAVSRVPVNDVVDVLSLPEIGEKFGFEGDLSYLRRWLKDAGIRWALDSEHKRDFIGKNDSGQTVGDEPFDDNKYTFDDGMHRLFISYAMHDEQNIPFNKWMPAGQVSGNASLQLGQLWLFFKQLKELKDNLGEDKNDRKGKTPDRWKAIWLEALDNFLKVPYKKQKDDEDVRKRITDLCDEMGKVPDIRVPPRVALQALKKALDGITPGSVPSGSVTFSPMSNLRNLPFKHIFVIGLNDGAFPALVSPDEFDLTHSAPKINIRSQRDIDKNVFLDLLLSARESLYLSYSGKSIRDDTERQPSILISELLDALLPALAKDGTKDGLKEAYKQLVVSHPLHPFSDKYFFKTSEQENDERLFSFRKDLFKALVTRKEEELEKRKRLQTESSSAGKTGSNGNDTDGDNTDENNGSDRDGNGGDTPVLPRGSAPFLAKDPVTAPANSQEVSLDELIRFFENPSRYLLRNRLGINFPYVEEELPADEPFIADRKSSQELGERLLPLYMNLQDVSDEDKKENLSKVARAGYEFPQGAYGETLLDNELDVFMEFAGRVSEAMMANEIPEGKAFGVQTISSGKPDEWRLSGTLADAGRTGLVRCQYSDTPYDGDNSSNHYDWNAMEHWIRHLFLNACAPEGIGCRSVWHFRNGCTELPEVEGGKETAIELLDDLITIYREGSTRRLPFFPKESWLLWFKGRKKQNWAPKNNNSGLFYQLAFREVENPLDSDAPPDREGTLPENGNTGEKTDYSFEELAERVFGPLKFKEGDA